MTGLATPAGARHDRRMTQRISDLARNDVPGAIAFIEQQLDAGTYSSDDAQSVTMLQDDPGPLIEAYTQLLAKRRKLGRPVYVKGAGHAD